MSDQSKTHAVYVPVRSITKMPPRNTVKTARDIAGKNPPLNNLKDHPEFDGLNCMIFAGVVAQGDQSNYVLCPAIIYADSVDPWSLTDEEREDMTVILSTGSANFMDRVQTAIATNGFPFVGKLRRAGRAWFLD